MKNKFLKKVIASVITLAMVIQLAGFPILVNAIPNPEDAKIYLDFEENTVGSEPESPYAGAQALSVTDGAGNATGLTTYSAAAGRSDAYHYVSGNNQNKYLVYKVDEPSNRYGYYNASLSLTDFRRKTGDQSGKTFIYEAKVRFVENNAAFVIMNGRDTNQGRDAEQIAGMSFVDGVMTCTATGANLTNNIYTGLSREDWYKVTIVYSVNTYVSFKLEKVNGDGTLTVIGSCSGVPATTGDYANTVGTAAFVNLATGTTIAYLDDICWTTVAPSASLKITLEGENSVTKEKSTVQQVQYRISQILHNEQDKIVIPSVSIGAVWSLRDNNGNSINPSTGFSIDQNGLLTADGTTAVGEYDFNVVVRSGSDTSYSEAKLPVHFTVVADSAKYYDVTIKYIDEVTGEEVKTARVIPAQKEGTVVSCDQSDTVTFDATAKDGKTYRYVYYPEHSDPLITVSESKTVITLNFTRTLITSMTVNFLEEETQNQLKSPQVVTGLLEGTTYEVDKAFLAAFLSGTTVYVPSSNNQTAVTVTENGTINLYFTALEDEYYMYEDFESYEIGTMGGIGGAYPGTSSVADSTAVGGTGKAFKIEAEKTNACRVAVKTFETPIDLGAKINIEYDWYGGYRQDSSKGTGADVTFIDENQQSVVSIEQQDAALRYYWGGKAQLAGNSDSVNWGVNDNESQAVEINENLTGANKWYHIAITINKPAGVMEITATDKSSGVSGTVKVDISSMTSSTISRIRFATDKANTSYVDNIKIYKRAGEYLVTSFVEGSLDSWTKTSGSPAYAYDILEGEASAYTFEDNGDITICKTTYTNTTENEIKARLYLAEYDNAKLKNIKISDEVTIGSGETKELSVSLSASKTAGTYINAFLWDSKLKPLQPSYLNENLREEKAYVTVTGDSKIKSPAFEAKNLVVAEYDVEIKNSNDSFSSELLNGDTTVASYGVTGGKFIVTGTGQTTVLDTVVPGWYTVTSSIDLNNNTLSIAVLKDGKRTVRTDIAIADADKITNIAFSTSNAYSLAELKIIEGKPKNITLKAPSVLDIQKGANSIDITAIAEYKVATTQTLVNYDWQLTAVNSTGLTLTKKDDHTATLSATADAKAQVVTVTASNGKVSDSVKIRIASSANNIVFEKYANKALIPFEGSTVIDFAAKAVDGNMKELTDRTVTYDLCDANLNALTNLTGVSIDANTGVLTVLPTAEKGTVYVRASEPTEGLYEVVKVVLHGYAFDFGFADSDSVSNVKEGYIAITSADIYSEKIGYGLSASTAGYATETKGTSTDLLLGDYLEANQKFTFLIDLPNGEYTVKSVHRGTILTEAAPEGTGLSNLVIGEAKTSVTSETALEEKTFTVSVVDGQMDLNFDVALNTGYVYSNAGDKNVAVNNKPAVASVEITKLRDLPAPNAEPTGTPTWYIVGDSTSKNSSPIYGYGDVMQQYIGNMATVSNQGSAGRSLLSYYCQNRFAYVLANVKPGDIVTFGMGINNKGDTTESYLYQMKYMIEGVKQRGGIPIVLTPTPLGISFNGDGSVKTSSWNSSTNLMNYRTADYTGSQYLRAAEENGVPFINLDHLATDALNAELSKTADTTERYNIFKSYWSDHNHMFESCARIVAKTLADAVVDVLVDQYGWTDTREK